MTELQAKSSSHPGAALITRFDDRDALIGVIGLGYVGLPVATSFAEAGFRVLGVDTDRSRVTSIEEGRSYIRDVDDDRIVPLTRSKRLRVSTSYRGLARAQAIIISVPTPLADGIPDLSGIEAAGRSIAKVLTAGTLVVLESTTFPGTTEEVLRPLLEASGLVAGRDFLLAYSPERIDPGNDRYGFTEIPKIVGGMTEESTRAAVTLYGHAVSKVTPVSGTREAEMAKLIENTFRHVNIALVNELTQYAHEWGIDIWEAIEAAATKPFGFMPFWPSPGWGGHCIPLDPAYLSWRVRRDHYHEMRFIELAQTLNAEMPKYVVERIALLLNQGGKALRGSSVLCVGAAYKSGTSDTRGSSAQKILAILAHRGAVVSFHDPLVAWLQTSNGVFASSPLTLDVLREQDLVVALIPQQDVEWQLVLTEASLILDCCNALKGRKPHVARL
jgi:UDP-N-acetyl-D-glucosamine dehydrogenase